MPMDIKIPHDLSSCVTPRSLLLNDTGLCIGANGEKYNSLLRNSHFLILY